MKLTSFRRTKLQYEPDALAVEMVFERDGKVARKVAAVSGLRAKVASNHVNELKMQCARMAREADRDLAFMQYGADWRKHCEFTSDFWAPLLREEVEKITWQ